MKLHKPRFIDIVFIAALIFIAVGIAAGGAGGVFRQKRARSECALVLSLDEAINSPVARDKNESALGKARGGAGTAALTRDDIQENGGYAFIYADIPVKIISLTERLAFIKLTGIRTDIGFLAGGKKYLFLGQPLLVECGQSSFSATVKYILVTE